MAPAIRVTRDLWRIRGGGALSGDARFRGRHHRPNGTSPPVSWGLRSGQLSDNSLRINGLPIAIGSATNPARQLHAGVADMLISRLDQVVRKLALRLLRRPARSERSIIRVSVVAGFGVIFVLWSASAYEFRQNMWKVQGRMVGFHQRFAQTEMLLDEVRTGVLEASVDVRDALLDSSAKSDDYYRREVQDARTRVEEALAGYAPFVHSAVERRDFDELRQKVSDLFEVTEPILALDEAGRQGEALDALRDQILPRRQAVHLMSQHIARLNDGAAEDQRREVERAFAAVDRRAWLVGTLALLFTGAVTFVITRYAGRMERQIRRETQKNAENVKVLKRLSDRLVRAGEEERRTIARELHDEIGQSLTAVKMDLAHAAAVCGGNGSQLEAARHGVDGAIENVRTLSRMLHPMVLEDLGLQAAVDWHLRAFAKRSGIDVSFSHAGLDARLAPSIEACIYRTIQEATNNVAKHADANHCRVTVEHSAGRVMAIVEDDGRGMEATQAAPADAPRGLGLISIRERILGFGGEVQIGAADGRGTRIHVDMPASPGPATRLDGVY
jgi:signal transduction histidine kinase